MGRMTEVGSRGEHVNGLGPIPVSARTEIKMSFGQEGRFAHRWVDGAALLPIS